MGIGKWIVGGVGLAAASGSAVAFAQYRDIEKPANEVVMADEAFELRQYGAMIVTEVTHTARRCDAHGSARAAYGDGEVCRECH
jgi:hypothetical protein